MTFAVFKFKLLMASNTFDIPKLSSFFLKIISRRRRRRRSTWVAPPRPELKGVRRVRGIGLKGEIKNKIVL